MDKIIRYKLYTIKRKIIKLLYEIKVFFSVSGKGKQYDFNSAKQYWQNVPKAMGSNPWNTEKLKYISDENLVVQFKEEQKISREKFERQLGFKRAFESIQDIENPKVMDYGSGIGFYGFEILSHCSNAQVTFVDINQSNLNIIQRIAELLKFEQQITICQVQKKKSLDLNFKNTFNLIMSMGVLHHTPFAKDIVSHLTQYLDSKGIFLVLLYNNHYRKRLSQNKGYRLNHSTFGELTDPIIDEIKNPYSDWYDDDKAIDLFGHNYNLISRDYPTPDYNTYRFEKF